MAVLVLYEVVTNSDLTEGKGHLVSLGFCSDIEVAAVNAIGKGVYGQDADVWRVEVFTTSEEIIEAGAISYRIQKVYDRNGWLDGPDDPRKTNSDWKEYLRLKERFKGWAE